MSTPTIPDMPEGMHQLSPHLVCTGAADAIDFYVKAFGASELMRLAGADGQILHASVSINGSSVMLMDEMLDYGVKSPTTLGGSAVTIHLIVDDSDAWFDRAVGAGATPTMPVEDQFWGDRYGVITDPFGHLWALATPSAEAPTGADLVAAAAAAGETM